MIGIDLVKISRIQEFYDRFGKKALERFLDEDEIALCKDKIESISGFYAAKEAISKALGTGISKELSFLDIKLHKTKKNAPYFTLPKRVIDSYDIVETSLSITHEKEYTIAVAILKTKYPNQELPLFH